MEEPFEPPSLVRHEALPNLHLNARCLTCGSLGTTHWIRDALLLGARSATASFFVAKEAPSCAWYLVREESFATFTYYPIVQHTNVAEERESNDDFGAEGLATVGGGMRRQSAAPGFSLPSALEPKTRIVRPGGYEHILLTCDTKAHLQMNVKVGALLNMTAGANGMMGATGTLQLLDLMPVCGNTMLVLRRPRLETPCIYDAAGWPCTSDETCAISGQAVVD